MIFKQYNKKTSSPKKTNQKKTTQMKQSKKITDKFEDELQGKLNQISQRRSNKKLKNKSNLIYQTRCINQMDYSGIVYKNNLQTNHCQQTKQHNISPQPKPHTQLPKLQNTPNEQNSQQKHKQKHHKQYETIQNKQLYKFLQNIGDNKQIIDLSYFLAKLLTMYSSQNQLSQEIIKQIFLLFQMEITTTDPNIVSINALELAVKKKGDSFKMYVIDKIMEGKLIVQGKKIREKEKIVQKSLLQTEQNLRNKQKQLLQKQKQFADRQKQIIKKQRQNNIKQKQLIQRIKNSKKILQQKGKKLIESHALQLQIICQKIQKKMLNYDKNIKCKFQNIGLKLNQIHKLKQIKQIDIKNIIIKQLQDKYQKIYNNKYKKYQNDINQFVKKQQCNQKSIQSLQNDNKGLMKVCNKLQIKINKQQNKIKQLLVELQHKICQIKQLKSTIDHKNKQNQQIMNKLSKITKSNNKKDDNSNSQDIANDGTKQVKQNPMSTCKSKKSLSSKKKNSNSNHKQNTIVLQVEEVVDIYETALENYGKQVKVDRENNVKYLQQMLELSTKLYLYHEKQCKQLIKMIYQNTITNINNHLMQQHKNNSNNRILSFLSQMQICYPKQSAEAIYKYYITLNNKNNKYKQEIKLWKFLVIFCLFSPNLQSSYYWLKAISEVWQNGQVQNQMKDSIFGSHKQQNFMLAIVIKLFIPHHSIDLNILDIISQMLLNMKLVGQQIYSQFWNSNNIGILLIKDYTVIVRNILQNSMELQQDQMEQVQRVSILIQRLVVGYNIMIKTQYCQYFDQLRRKCRGTLLERNLNSILQSYDAKTQQILKQLDDV